VLPADYTLVPATDAGTHTFSITLNSLGSQTITATDTQTPAINASATASVNHQR
jgi:predicted RNA methylase